MKCHLRPRPVHSRNRDSSRSRLIRRHHFVLIAIAGILSLVASPTAMASVTYTYTGNSFTSVNGNIGATLSNHISISFSVAASLASNLNCATLQVGGTGSLLSFSMTDGVNTYGSTQNATVQCVSTSETGQITQWSIGAGNFPGGFPYIVSTNIPNFGNVNDISALTTSDFAEVRNNPGVWSQGDATTIDFTDRAAFFAATNNLTTVGFSGILPPGVRFGGYGQLDLPGVTFSTPLSGTFVNVTAADYYLPNVYPQDFIVDSVNQNTGLPNSNNQLVISLAKPTFAVGLDLGGLGFSGAGSGTITLSNGHVFAIPILPTVGRTTFVGFISSSPITTLSFATTNDSWVVEDLVLASPVVSSCTFSLAPTGQKVSSQGGLGSFDISTGAGCSWQLVFSDAWIGPFSPILSPGGGPPQGTGPRTVTYRVDANDGTARSGTISVGSQSFLVNQDGVNSPCSFSISPPRAAFDASGGDARVVVNTANGCAWSATSNVGWLSITFPSSGTGRGTVFLHVSANTGGARSGTATMGGQTFTVTQVAPGAGACGALDLSATSQVRVSRGGLTPVQGVGAPYQYTQEIIITNQSGSVLHAPLFLVLVGVPNHKPYPYTTDVFGKDRQTTCFSPQGDAMFQITTGDMSPGTSIRIEPLFWLDIQAGLSYTPRVLSGAPSR